jgi:hypothetical protein
MPGDLRNDTVRITATYGSLRGKTVAYVDHINTGFCQNPILTPSAVLDSRPMQRVAPGLPR